MKMIRLSIILFFFIFLFSCENKENDIIKIGVILPLTGEVATYGQAVKSGLELALDSLNLSMFTFVYEDSKANNRVAINALEKLFSENIDYFIGDATSTVTYQIAPRIEGKNKLLLVPIATGDKIRELGRNIFMLSPRNEKQTKRIASFIKERFNEQRIGCFFKQNDYGVNIANTFFELFENEVESQSYLEGQRDFRSSLITLKQKNISVIFLPGNYEETALILKQAKEIGYNAKFIGTDGAYSPLLISNAQGASEGFLLTMMPVNSESSIYKDFEKKYIQKYNGNKPDIFACYGYESGLILMKAIMSTNNFGVDSARTYLLTNSFNSLTGEMRFDDQGEALRDYSIYEVKEGEFVLFEK